MMPRIYHVPAHSLASRARNFRSRRAGRPRVSWYSTRLLLVRESALCGCMRKAPAPALAWRVIVDILIAMDEAAGRGSHYPAIRTVRMLGPEGQCVVRASQTEVICLTR